MLTIGKTDIPITMDETQEEAEDDDGDDGQPESDLPLGQVIQDLLDQPIDYRPVTSRAVNHDENVDAVAVDPEMEPRQLRRIRKPNKMFNNPDWWNHVLEPLKDNTGAAEEGEDNSEGSEGSASSMFRMDLDSE